VVTIDNVAFRNRSGYLQALRMASQHPSIVVVNVRTGRLTRVSCRFPHVHYDERFNENAVGLAIDLAQDMRGI